MAAASRTRRSTLPSTAAGSHLDAFGLRDWSVLGLIALIWGSSFFFMAIGLETFRPGVVTFARVGLGTMTLALVPKARSRVDRDDLPRIAMLGLIWIGFPLILFPIAQQWIDSSVAGMINGAVPVASTLWAVLLLRRLPRWRQTLGIALGFIGLIAISIPEVADSSATALGTVLVLVAILMYGLATNLAVPLQQKYGALPVLFRAQLSALTIVVPFGLLQIPGSTWSLRSAAAMVPLGILGTAAAFVLLTNLIGRVGATRGSLPIYFVPIVAIALGAVILDEEIAPIAILGMVLVLAGAWFASRKEV